MRTLLLFVTLALLAFACGGDDDAPAYVAPELRSTSAFIDQCGNELYSGVGRRAERA